MMTKKSQDLYTRAKKLIPGGTQLLSKRPELFLPEQWPAYYSKAFGVEVWDLDGNRYLDMSESAVGSCPLGYCDPDVNKAVTERVANGSMCSLNCPEEVKLAEVLCELHPWADMVRYARTGGEALAIGVRVARAASGRDKVAFCGYHGWHDWYLSANLGDDKTLDDQLLSGLDTAGVPRAMRGLTLAFHYNRIDELKAIVEKHGSEIGVIIMEPVRHYAPDPGFIEAVRKIADDIGAVLIFDEVTMAWRVNIGGYHLNFTVKPDIAVFAKAMSNGYPMGAIIGRRDVMQAAQKTFISSTYWTEGVGPAAALATIAKFQSYNVQADLIDRGKQIIAGWKAAASESGLKIHVHDFIPSLTGFDILDEEASAIKTLFTQIMLDKGFLATTSFYAMYAHQSHQVDVFVDAVRDAFRQIVAAKTEGTVQKQLRGPVAHSKFERFN